MKARVAEKMLKTGRTNFPLPDVIMAVNPAAQRLLGIVEMEGFEPVQAEK